MHCPSLLLSRSLLSSPGSVFLAVLAMQHPRTGGQMSPRLLHGPVVTASAGHLQSRCLAPAPHQGSCCDGLKKRPKPSSGELRCQGISGHEPAAPGHLVRDGGGVFHLGPENAHLGLSEKNVAGWAGEGEAAWRAQSDVLPCPCPASHS